MMETAKEALQTKREAVERNLANGLMPFTKLYLGSYRQHFSTIGLNGMHEACLNLLGKGIDTPAGKEFALNTLHFMREKLQQFQEETGNFYNLEAVPCESATYRFAKKDVEAFPDIITAGTKERPYYTNSTHLPVNHTQDIFEALDHQDELQTLYTGGTVLHGFMGEKVSDWKATRNLVKSIAYSYRLPYFTITPTFSICPEHGYISGEHWECPHATTDKNGSVVACEHLPEVYSRIVGYFRPVQNWNHGKKQEFADRMEYTEPVPKVESLARALGAGMSAS